jgi:hypothetical protein
MLGRLPAQVRHLLLLLLAAGLTFVIEQLPSVELSPVVASAVTLLVTALLAWVTPLIQSYGLGQLGAEATDLDALAEATNNSDRPEDGPQDISQDPELVLVSEVVNESEDL